MEATYSFKSASGGDYGGCESSEQLERTMRANIMRARTAVERAHALDQVSYFAAARSINSERADRLRALLLVPRGGSVLP